MSEIADTVVSSLTGGMVDVNKGRFQLPGSKGWWNSSALKTAKDAGAVVSLGMADPHKGRFYVPFSSGQMRNYGKGIGNIATGGYARDTINQQLDTPNARLAGTAAGVVAGAAAGAGAGGAVGPAVGVSSSTGALAGTAAGAQGALSIAQADAIQKNAPELKLPAPVNNANMAVQKAVAEAASRRSRSRSQRSTILSQNFLNPSNPALKQTYGS